MRLSYSSIQTYETCPAKYRFRYEERLPTAPSPALSFGDSIHQALHRFHDRPVPVAPSEDELLEMLEAVWVSDGYRSPEEETPYREHARQVLRAYHRENAADYRIPAALEHRFRIEVGTVELSGVIDRMDRLPGGGYEIIDYKTNRRLPPRGRVERDLQLSIYALAAREIWGIEPERLTLYFLLPGQRMSVTRSDEDVAALRARIADIAGAIEESRFEARENPLCGWCDFQDRCPVFRHRSDRGEAPNITALVDEWVRLEDEDRARDARRREIASTLRAYGREHGYARLFGDEGASVRLVEDGEPLEDLVVVRGRDRAGR